MVDTFPLVGGDVEGLCYACISLWTIADGRGDMAFRQAPSHLVVLYRLVQPWIAFLGETHGSLGEVIHLGIGRPGPL
jgi:hypothetical protein